MVYCTGEQKKGQIVSEILFSEQSLWQYMCGHKATLFKTTAPYRHMIESWHNLPEKKQVEIVPTLRVISSRHIPVYAGLHRRFAAVATILVQVGDVFFVY
ncbi:MAG: hypothetical protein R2867_24935 [Caldilineaceae bacterium]